MSRTISNTVDYFPHFAKHGKTLFILKSRFGNDGYAFWFQLLELLSQSKNHFYDCRNEEPWQYLLSFCGSNVITGTEILGLLAKLGNIDAELWQQRIVWCQALVDNFTDIYKKRGRGIPLKPVPDTSNGIIGNKNALFATEMPQSKVNNSKVNNIPPKGGPRKTRPTNNKKDATVKEIFTEMQVYLGFPEKISQDPIPSYGKEGQAIKRMLTRGFTREAIVECWKGKVSQRGGEFQSMTWVNEDIGKPEKSKQGVRRLSTAEEIAASIRKVRS